MILLLSGSSEIGRTAIAERIARKRRRWKHIPLEAINRSLVIFGLDLESGDDLPMHIACECAKEMHEEGEHILLTASEVQKSLVDLLRTEVAEGFLAAHLGDEDSHALARTYDLVLDPRKLTVAQTCTILLKFIEGV